jgi:hypothetical protein
MAFHGTTDAIQINDKILPSVETGYLRESFRHKNLDVVFLTVSKASAEYYAKKAVKQYGGNPVIYNATPEGFIERNGTEIICDWATINGIA